MNDYNLTLNQSECLREMTHFGFQRVHNVCTGAATDVPWGFGEYALVALAASAVVVLVAGFIAIMRV